MTPKQLAKQLIKSLFDEERVYGSQPYDGLLLTNASLRGDLDDRHVQITLTFRDDMGRSDDVVVKRYSLTED